MSYTPMSRFAAPEKTAQVWRLILGLVLGTLVYGLVMAAMGAGLLVWLDPETLDDIDRAMASLETVSFDSPWAMLAMLATFVGMGAGAMVAAKMAHGRGPGTLFGPAGAMTRDFILGVLACGVVIGIGLGIYALTDMPRPNMDPSVWLRFLPLALLGVLIQTGAEEILFRGYLQQQLAARFSSPVVWMVFPSVLFGLAHYSPDLGSAAFTVVAATGLFGLVAADLTARTGTIGVAWGLHFANNVSAMLIVSADPRLAGLALFSLPDSPIDPAGSPLAPLLLADIAGVLVLWGLARWAVRR